MSRDSILAEIHAERLAQDRKWGEQNHRDGTGGRYTRAAFNARNACQIAHRYAEDEWRLILDEEVREAFAESDPAKLRAELVQVAAVAAQWVEAIDRRPAAGASS